MPVTPSRPSPLASPSSLSILEGFRRGAALDIDLTLRPAYRELLEKLGNPQDRLPPVLHVAGTNGKGSTCAFLRAMLEAAGYKVHVYTSPHLVEFYERIRIAGECISEDELTDILKMCERQAMPGAITYFEAATAAAFVAFARHPADFTILEVGLGGRLDATNVVKKKCATLITRISYDHRDYLGNTLREIAREKAGIMQAGVPCFSAPQPDAETREALQAAALSMPTSLSMGGEDWRVEPREEGFRYHGNSGTFDLPAPLLTGAHQYENAGLAITALMGIRVERLSFQSFPSPILRGLQTVVWPGRLQKLEKGRFPELLPPDWEVWLDGGHNDSAGEVLASQAAVWCREDGRKARPLYLIFGMLTTKDPREFLSPLVPYVKAVHTVLIPDEPLASSPARLASEAHAAGIEHVESAEDISEAIKNIIKGSKAGRILICGSLYLAGYVLKMNLEKNNL